MKIRVTAVQTNPRLGQVSKNLDRIIRGILEAKTQLVVFPECALQGYAFDSKDEAMKLAETVPGPSTEEIEAACRERGVWAIVGMLEREGDRLFNAAAVIGPHGIAGTYRKMHLPYLGVDRFAAPGDKGFPVFQTNLGRIGVLICYDLSFPEAARVLKLDGAQLVCVPTNWPMAAEISCNHSPMVRAQENHVNILTCNRVGEEGGFRFRGESRIVDFDGKVLAQAGADEATLSGELDMDAADQNRVVIIPGKYELDRLGHRRPDHYGRLTK